MWGIVNSAVNNSLIYSSGLFLSYKYCAICRIYTTEYKSYICEKISDQHELATCTTPGNDIAKLHIHLIVQRIHGQGTTNSE